MLEQYEDLDRSQCLAPGELGGVRLHGCSKDQQDSRGKSLRGALRGGRVDTADCSIDHGELGGLLHNLVDNCGSGPKDNFARTLHCAHMNC